MRHRSTPGRTAAWLAATALAAALAASPAAARDAPAPPAPGMPHFAVLHAFEGLPGDSVGRRHVLAGVRSAFAAILFPTEEVGGPEEQPRPSLPLSNRFRLIEGGDPENAWEVEVAIHPEGRFEGGAVGGANPDSSLHMLVFRVYVAALSPEGYARGDKPTPVGTRLSFREPRSDAEAVALYDRVGYAVGELMLEQLHHLSGELPKNAEFEIKDAWRGPIP